MMHLEHSLIGAAPRDWQAVFSVLAARVLACCARGGPCSRCSLSHTLSCRV